MKKKINVEVVRTDEYEIEIDESIWDEKALANWSNVFWKVKSTEELAETIGYVLMKNDIEDFIEGFGYLLAFYLNGNEVNSFQKDKCKGIRIQIVNRDSDYDYTVN